MLERTILEKEIYPHSPYPSEGVFKDRLTGKAIIFDEEGNIALIARNAHPYLLLPGGGIDEGETVHDGLVRECKEEVGVDVELGVCVGVITDYRGRDMKRCITHCYVAHVVGEKGEPELTADEIAAGVYVRWVPFAEAVTILAEQIPDLRAEGVTFYNAGFNMYRDYLFLEELTVC